MCPCTYDTTAELGKHVAKQILQLHLPFRKEAQRYSGIQMSVRDASEGVIATKPRLRQGSRQS